MRLTKKVTKKFMVPNEPDKAWVLIKNLKINEVKKIESQANEMYFSADSKGEGSTRINFDPYTRSRLFAHACIEDWGGMNSTMGKPMPFNAQNLDKAAEFVVEIDGEEFDFYGWIDKCREELAAEVEEEKEKATKN